MLKVGWKFLAPPTLNNSLNLSSVGYNRPVGNNIVVN